MITSYTGFCVDFDEHSPIQGEQFIQILGEESGATDANHFLISVPVKSGTKTFVAGVVLRDRKAKHFTIREASGGTEVIRPQKLGAGQNVVDINFFLIDAQSWRGLYTHYHLSVSLPAFLNLLARRYNAACMDGKKAALAEADVKPTSAKGKEISALWRKKLVTAAIVPKGKLADLVSRFREVDNFEFAVDSVAYPQSDLVALSRLAKSERHILRFGSAGNGAGIVAAVTSATRKAHNYLKLRISGTNEFGLKQTLTLDDVPERLGEDEYDAWVEKIALDTKSWSTTLESCPAIQRLTKLAGDKRIAALLSAKPA